MRKRLGDILVESGVISQKQLEDALDEQKRSKRRLGEILISKGILDEDAIADVLSNQLRLERVRLRNTVISPDVVRIIPESVARRYNIVPVSLHGDTLKVAFSDPLDVRAQDELSFLTGYRIEPVVATPSEISQTIENLYSIKEEARRLVESIAANRREATPEAEVEENAPVVKLVNYIISRAVEEGASDIHFEPQEDGLLIRYRVDGLLRYVEQFSLDMALPVVSRLKIMAGMDIAEKRLPQDGRVVLRVGDKDVDIRISTLPTVYGEKVVLRLLDRTSILIGLEKLGLLEDDMKKILQMISHPY
ncbi:MAG: Flp pilus assembly complex ATPase component TadA, partial [Synergistetes bacterium]|nr:Flp pilus assembly complex ATPase component TadA [Synergistota bacterium]